MRFSTPVLLLTFACATHRPAPTIEEVPQTANTSSRRLGPPHVWTRPPSGALDLGPVQLPELEDATVFGLVLQAKADDLGADGFVVEPEDTYRVRSGGLGFRIYPFGASRSHSVGYAILVAAVAAAVQGIEGLPTPDPKARYFVTAYRLASSEAGAKSLEAGVLPEALRLRVLAEPTLKKQLELLAALADEGEIDAARYEAARLELLRR